MTRGNETDVITISSPEEKCTIIGASNFVKIDYKKYLSHSLLEGRKESCPDIFSNEVQDDKPV